MKEQQPVEVRTRDYWFKIVEFLQRNWALIEQERTGEEPRGAAE